MRLSVHFSGVEGQRRLDLRLREARDPPARSSPDDDDSAGTGAGGGAAAAASIAPRPLQNGVVEELGREILGRRRRGRRLLREHRPRAPQHGVIHWIHDDDWRVIHNPDAREVARNCPVERRARPPQHRVRREVALGALAQLVDPLVDLGWVWETPAPPTTNPSSSPL